MKSLIYMETQDGAVQGSSLEAISAASAVGDPAAVVIGDAAAAETAAKYAPSVILIDAAASCEDEVVYLLEKTARDVQAGAVFFGATAQGKDLAPRLAARLKTGCVTDVTDVKNENGVVSCVRPAYGGSIWEKMSFAEGKTAVMSVRGGSFAKPEASAAGNVEKLSESVPADQVKAKFVERTVEITESVNLEGADVVVTCGRGACGSDETFAMVKELADLLGGEVGATRPVIDDGKISKAHQVGQSGKNVAPKLYIACGVSGSMQHISGMSGSDYIVSINKDEDAPIFAISDVSIVGRCEDILPLLIAEIRKRKE